jgi:hypothetical protein
MIGWVILTFPVLVATKKYCWTNCKNFFFRSIKEIVRNYRVEILKKNAGGKAFS